MHDEARLAPRFPLAASFSKIFTPAGVLLVVVVLAGVRAGLGILGVTALALGVIVVPGLAYKKFSLLAGPFGMPATWRTRVVTILTVVGALACALLNVPAPVPATVVALVAGNAGLALARRWMNASAHVSVLTFAVLWGTAVFGPAAAWLLVLSPMMLISRTALREHTWGEAVVGAFIGMVSFGCFVGANNWSWIS
ncbi:hypothetical protein [Arthrobacter cavernae]|uniref:Phosphatase PAP2 family protein n=1 Tax=Arthrobacter cavernae TaxID=2817681 RepID=A0A939HEM5_9MICC|nr:hypothetical protein [Arthrobacter cavernae]MBO1269507.1 hypothetical protein [Arthrobacter cavernae]